MPNPISLTLVSHTVSDHLPHSMTTSFSSSLYGPDDGFARLAWFEMLEKLCFADRQCLWPHARHGNASAILPLMAEDDGLASLANYYSFSYGPVFDGAQSDEQRRALITSIATQLRMAHGHIRFYPLLEEDGTAALLRGAFADAGWIALLTDQGNNYVLDVGGQDFNTYWARRPGALRSSVRRKGRGNPYEFTIYQQMNDDLWRTYQCIYASSWKRMETYPLMIRAMAEEAGRRGALRLGLARAADGTPVAAQIWTIEGKTACIHKIAHVIRHDKGSPGTLLSHHMFRHMLDEEKVAMIDYGTGNNAYKQDWMNRKRPLLRLDCFNPRRAAMWLPALKTRISQLVRKPA